MKFPNPQLSLLSIVDPAKELTMFCAQPAGQASVRQLSVFVTFVLYKVSNTVFIQHCSVYSYCVSTQYQASVLGRIAYRQISQDCGWAAPWVRLSPQLWN